MTKIVVEYFVDKDGVGWKVFSGPTRDIPYRTETLAELHRRDGSKEIIEVEPYSLKVQLNPAKVQELVRTGIWSIEDLPPGLALAEQFVVPEGMQIVGEARYEGEIDDLRQVFDVEPIPEPVVIKEPTRTEKLERLLNDYDLTIEDLKAEVVDETKVATR